MSFAGNAGSRPGSGSSSSHSSNNRPGSSHSSNSNHGSNNHSNNSSSRSNNNHSNSSHNNSNHNSNSNSNSSRSNNNSNQPYANQYQISRPNTTAGNNSRNVNSNNNQQRDPARQQAIQMIRGSSKVLGIREQRQIAAKTGLDPATIIRMAEKRGLEIKTPKSAKDEQDNQAIDNSNEGNINGENGNSENGNSENGIDETDWSARFDELNSQWEERFSNFENSFNTYKEDDDKRHGEVTKKVEDLRSDSNFDTGSLGNDSVASGGHYQNNLERLFQDSRDDPTVVNPASTGYSGAAGSGGARDNVREFTDGRSPNGAYVNDPRDYYNSGTVGAKTTIDLDDPDALMKRSEVRRRTTPGGQELAGSALGLEV